MSLLLISMLAAATRQPPTITAPEPKNFSVTRYILPAMPSGIASQPTDVRVGIELLIDPDGKPADCRIIDAGTSKPMAEWLCDNMRRRSRFIPARDRFGTALYSYYPYWHTFGFSNVVGHTSSTPDATLRISDHSLRVPHSLSKLALLISVQGRVETCEVLKSAGISQLDVTACIYVKHEQFQILKTQSGDPVPSVRIFTVSYRE